jgi:hypothetical protein
LKIEFLKMTQNSEHSPLLSLNIVTQRTAMNPRSFAKDSYSFWVNSYQYSALLNP